MDTPLVVTPTATRPASRQPLSALSKWTVVSLAAMVVLLIWLELVLEVSARACSARQLPVCPPVALILGLPALVVAVLIVATRRRWAPLLGVLYWILLIAANMRHLASDEWRIPHDLAHPEYFDTFAFTVVMLAVAVVGIVSGVSATIQNYRAPTAAEMDDARRQTPRWFPALLAALAGLALGAIVVAAIPRAAVGGGMSDSELATLPALSAVRTGFDRGELRVKAGEVVALRLENRDTVVHSFNLDELNLHVLMRPGKPGLALFKTGTPGTYTFYSDVGDDRWMGMVGTLIVEP